MHLQNKIIRSSNWHRGIKGSLHQLHTNFLALPESEGGARWKKQWKKFILLVSICPWLPETWYTDEGSKNFKIICSIEVTLSWRKTLNKIQLHFQNNCTAAQLCSRQQQQQQQQHFGSVWTREKGGETGRNRGCREVCRLFRERNR